MIAQLVYISEPRFDPSTELGRNHVAAILGAAHNHNREAGITGHLLIGQTWIAQVLEGPSKAISALFHRLLADPRHTNIRLIDTRMIESRRFAGWDMAYSEITDPEHMIPVLVAEARDAAPGSLAFNDLIAALTAADIPVQPNNARGI